MIDPNNLTVSFLDQIIKANQESLEKIDDVLAKDPKAKADFDQTVKNLQQVRTDTTDLLGMLFDQLGTTVREDKGYKYIDPSLHRPIPYRYLRAAGATDVPNMIKNLRRLQLSEFAVPASRKKYGREMGISFVWTGNGEPKKGQKEEMLNWERRFADGFFFAPGEDRPNLAKFLGVCYSDFFELDDITIAIIRDATFAPIAMQLQDPRLWVPTVPKVRGFQRYLDADMLEDGKTPMEVIEVEEPEHDFLFVMNGTIQQAVTRDVLMKSHFFVRSDYRTWKRGYSIQEQALGITTVILNAMTYNASNFNNNRTPMGVLTLMGGYSSPMLLERLKKLIWAQMSGAANQHKVPIIGLPEKGDAKWVNIHGTAKEMEFYTGMTLFMSILFALSGTDPNEVGLANFHDAVKGGALNDTNRDGIFRKSRDNGLNTFLAHLERTLNAPMTDGRNVFQQITGLPIELEFKGIAEEDQKAKSEVNKARLAVDTSVNEIRRENGQDAAEYKVGEVNIYDLVAVDSTGIGALIRQGIQMDQQAEAQRQQMEQQQALAQQQGGQSAPQFTDRDQKLIDEYGPPEGEEQA